MWCRSRSIRKLRPLVVALAMLIGLAGHAFAQTKKSPMPTPDEDGISKAGLHYSIYGAGEPVLAIHGLGGSIYSWREFVKTPRPFVGRQILLIDLRGAGDSPKPRDHKYSILDQADLVYQFIQERKLTNLTIVGNSYGGAVSLLLAIRLCENEPGRLARLILIDSGGYNRDLPSHLTILRTPLIGWLAVHLLTPKAQIKKVLRDSYYDRHKITDEQIAEYARPLGLPNGRYALLQTGKQAIPKNIDELTAQYPRINVPTLILWGLDDKIIPIEIGKMLHTAIPGSRLEFINHAGHVPQEETPAETICWMREFMNIPAKPCLK
jgi:pimeloyl-ACP methyl ester carboxylesterase